MNDISCFESFLNKQYFELNIGALLSQFENTFSIASHIFTENLINLLKFVDTNELNERKRPLGSAKNHVLMGT